MCTRIGLSSPRTFTGPTRSGWPSTIASTRPRKPSRWRVCVHTCIVCVRVPASVLSRESVHHISRCEFALMYGQETQTNIQTHISTCMHTCILTHIGRPDESLKMLRQLTLNAVTENRYKDAGYYYWLLAHEELKQLKDLDEKRGSAPSAPSSSVPHSDSNGEQDTYSPSAYTMDAVMRGDGGAGGADGEEKEKIKALWRNFQKFYQKAEIYHAYDFIYRYTDEPFTSLLPDALFQTSQYIINNTREVTPFGVSKVRACMQAGLCAHDFKPKYTSVCQ